MARSRKRPASPFFIRLEGQPEQFTGVNLNGGKDPVHPASFAGHGKTGGVLAVGHRLYAWLNLQNGRWPDVDQALIWSDDGAATWKRSRWVFSRGRGRFKPATFLNFGKGFTGIPGEHRGHVYFYGQRQGETENTYLGRVPQDQLEDRRAYEFLSGFDGDKLQWSSDSGKAYPVFADARGTGDLTGVVYAPGLKRYLLSNFHKGPGQLGLFDGLNPWGPWTTVAYEEHWGGMRVDGEGLTCSFPQKWMSADGRTLWCIFSVYGPGARQGINAHDRLNVVKATLHLR